MYRLILLLALTLPAAAQMKQNGIELIPSTDNTAPGYLDFKSLRPSAYRVRITGPTGLTSNVDLKWPATLPTANGQCIAGLVGGQLYFGSAACGERMVSDYNWSQTIGARSGSGAITLTFADRCPFAGTDASGVVRVYEALVPTTYEFGLVTGGSCTRNGTGTLTVLGPTGTYTTAVATSASGGWQEAHFSVADGLPVKIRAKAGNYEIYSDILTEDRKVDIVCDAGAVLIPKTSGLKVFHVQSPSAIRINGCEIDNSTWLETAITGIYFNNPDGDAFGGRIENTTITSVENGIHGVTWYAIDAIGNLIINPTHAAIWVENVSTGDAGAGVLERNKLSCSATCDYGVLWNGPGAIEIKNNPINGFTEQIHLEPVHGYASTADSGANTVLTWVSGNRFRAAMVGKSVHVGTATCTVSTYTSSTSMTCNGVNLGSIGSSRYYAGTSGQAQVTGNLLDGAANTTHGVRWVGEISFTNAQIEGNFIANYTVNSAKGISLEGSGLAIATVKYNNIQGAPALTGTIGIDATAGGQYHLAINQISGYQTALNIGSSVLYGTVEVNRCVSFGTVCVANAASTVIVREAGPFAFADLPASAADGSVVYCSTCKATSAAVRTCAGSGTGATASRLNGVWKCEDGSPQSQWTPSGSDIYRVSKVGIGAAPVVGTQLSISGGSGANTFYMTDSTAANAFQVNAAATYTFLGNYANSPLILGTDSVARLRITPAGMFEPETTLATDFGSTTKHIRAFYGQSGEFMTSGGTAASDLLSTRKYKTCDSLGSSGCWDTQADVTVTASQKFDRDNAGDPFRYSIRQSSGSPVNYELLYADLVPARRETALGHSVTDTNLPKLGRSTLPWYEIWGTTGDFAGDLTIHGTTVAAGINYTGGYMTGTMRPLFSGTGKIGDTSYPYGNGYFSAMNVTASGFTLAATTTVGYCWIATSTGGAGAWTACPGGQWTTSGSDIYYNTGVVRIGDSASHIGATLELTNSTTVNLFQAKYTGSSGAGSGGGISAHLGAAPSAVNHRLGFLVFGVEASGTQYNRAAVLGFSAEAWSLGSAEGAYLQFATTATGSTTRTPRWRVSHDGHLLSESDGSYDIGATGASRPRSLFLTAGITAAGNFDFQTATLSGSLVMGSTTVFNTSRNAVGINAFAQSITFSAGSTYNVGSTGAPPLNIWGNYIEPLTELVLGSGVRFRGDLIPAVNNASAAGNTSFRLSTVVTTNLNVSGTISAPSGSAGQSTTITVRDSAGTGTCTIIFSGGLKTGGSC